MSTETVYAPSRVELMFRLPERSLPNEAQVVVQNALPTQLTASFGTGKRERLDYFDTFDFRLFSAGYALEKHRSRLILRKVDGEERMYEGVAPKRIEGLLPWELPTELRQLIEKTLSLRALRRVGVATIRRHHGEIRDDLGKIIARMELEEVYPESMVEPAARFLLVFPLRGYTEEARRAFGTQGNGLIPEEVGSIVAEAARWHGRGPKEYRSKPTVDLSPKEPAAKGLGDLLDAHLKIMQANEDGIINDIDTEFLHDYRVALRRMRSLLSEFKKVIPRETHDQLSLLLKQVSAPTGSVRDLDVLLLSREDYLSRVPKALEEGMERYFAQVARERKAKFRLLKEFLESLGYRETITHIENLTIELRRTRSKKSLKEAADRALSKRLRRVQGDLVSLAASEVSDMARHEVRIQCKKLRYLFEAVAPLYPKKHVNRAISQLKRFQDALGRLQDVAVQQDSLLAVIHGEERTQPRVAAAIGALVSSLSGESDSSLEGLITLISTYHHQLEETRRKLVPGEEKS